MKNTQRAMKLNNKKLPDFVWVVRKGSMRKQLLN